MRAKTDEVLNIKPEQIKSDPAGLPFVLEDFPADPKGNRIIPDELFSKYYKQLPNGTRNTTGNRIAYNGGMLSCLAADTEEAKAIRTAGADALNAKLARRRTFAESFDIALRQKASPEAIERLALDDNATNQDAIVAAALIEALTGNMKAQQFVRDTIGEMPTIKQEISADVMTTEDRELLQKIRSRQQDERRNERKTDQKGPDQSETE